jgi:hypothetical protein
VGYCDYTRNIPPQLQPLLALTGFVHDAGKGGEAQLEESDLRVGGKPQHPKEGFEMMLPSGSRESVDTVKAANPKRIDFEYHLRHHQDHCGSKGTFDFPQYFGEIKLSPREQAIVQIGTAMHYEFGGVVMKSLGDAPEPTHMKRVFDQFLAKLAQITARTAYGPVDELLVNIAIMIGAADVLGAKQVQLRPDQQSVYDFPDEAPRRSSGVDTFTSYGFKTRGRAFRLALLYYFTTGELQTFELATAPKSKPKRPGKEYVRPDIVLPRHSDEPDPDSPELLEERRRDRDEYGPSVTLELDDKLDAETIDEVIDRFGAGRVRELGTGLIATIVLAGRATKVSVAQLAEIARRKPVMWDTLQRCARQDGQAAVQWELAGNMVSQDESGNTVRVRAELIDAYLHDLPQSSSYLSVAEGQALAGAWHVRAEVFNQTQAPSGRSKRWVDRTTGRQFREHGRTQGDGNCLIHALSQVRTGKDASPKAVREARTAIANQVDHEAVSIQVQDLIRAMIEGAPQHGVGRRTLDLINADASVRRACHRAALARQKAQQASGEDVLDVSDLPDDEAAIADRPGEIVFNVTYGEQETDHTGILLFINNNHYIVLEKVGDDEEDDLGGHDDFGEDLALQHALLEQAKQTEQVPKLTNQRGLDTDQVHDLLGVDAKSLTADQPYTGSDGKTYTFLHETTSVFSLRKRVYTFIVA